MITYLKLGPKAIHIRAVNDGEDFAAKIQWIDVDQHTFELGFLKARFVVSLWHRRVVDPDVDDLRVLAEVVLQCSKLQTCWVRISWTVPAMRNGEMIFSVFTTAR